MKGIVSILLAGGACIGLAGQAMSQEAGRAQVGGPQPVTASSPLEAARPGEAGAGLRPTVQATGASTVAGDPFQASEVVPVSAPPVQGATDQYLAPASSYRTSAGGYSRGAYQGAYQPAAPSGACCPRGASEPCAGGAPCPYCGGTHPCAQPYNSCYQPCDVEEPGLLMSMLGMHDSDVQIYGWIEQGITFGDHEPDNRLLWGRLFDDRDDDYRFNQWALRIERPVSHDNGFDAGFMIDLLYGSDARFIHAVDLLDNQSDDSVQFDPIQFYGLFYVPGIDTEIKFGRFVTLQGAEVIAAPYNPLYSHSYIFNFGIPLSHTGVLLTTYLTDNLAVHYGLVNGINTFGDNNDALAFHGGATWTSDDERFNVYYSLHAGPEVPDNNTHYRVINSLVPSYQVTEQLRLMVDLNAGIDNSVEAHWWGTAWYAIYDFSEVFAGVLRFEWYQDDDGFTVAAFPENDDFADLLRGAPNTAIAGAPDSYFEVTLGLNVRPTENIILRPELRFDWADDTTPYADGTEGSQTTLATDLILRY